MLLLSSTKGIDFVQTNFQLIPFLISSFAATTGLLCLMVLFRSYIFSTTMPTEYPIHSLNNSNIVTHESVTQLVTLSDQW